MAIVRGLDRFEGASSFSTWSYRVATNACFDEMRRRRRRPDPQDPHLPETAGRRPSDALLDQQIVDNDEIRRCLERLNAQYREAVVLRDLVGMDYREIADTLGLPIGTVRSRIARGRRDLANILGNQSGSSDRQREHDD